MRVESSNSSGEIWQNFQTHSLIGGSLCLALFVVQRFRHRVGADGRPRLVSYARLRYDRLRETWLLLAPEKIFMVDEVAAAILERCDGQRTVDEIAGEMLDLFHGDAVEVSRDVRDFLQNWSDKLLLRW